MLNDATPVPAEVSIRWAMREVVGDASFDLEKRNVRSSSAARNFWVARAERSEFFIKCAPVGNLVGTDLDAFLSEKFSSTQLVPRFLGMRQAGSMEIGVWENVEGQTIEFGDYSDAQLTQLLSSLATIAACGADAPAPAKLRWSTPSLRRATEILAEEMPDDRRRLLAKVRIINRKIPSIINLAMRGPHGLVHNDFRGANVILRPSAPPCIIDWESATHGPLGANLRVFWNSPKRSMVTQIFSSALEKEGLIISPRRLALTLAIQQALWALDTGIRTGDLDRMRRGLKNLAAIITDKRYPETC